MSVPVPDVQLAIDSLSRCMADVSDWLDESHLRLNLGKTEVLWLGSKYCIDRVTVRDIPVLSVLIRVSDSASPTVGCQCRPRVVVVPVRILPASTTATGRQIHNRRRC